MPHPLSTYTLFTLSLSSNRESYGEGLQWAGCVIMTLLSQQKRFEALDFSYHLTRVYAVDKQDGQVQGYVSGTETWNRNEEVSA